MRSFLSDFKAFLKQNGENIYSIAEYRVGDGVSYEEVQPCNACNNIYSVSKVFTVTAVGMLCDRALLSTSEAVSEILKEEMPRGYHEAWDRTTVDMLLRHRIGVPDNALDIDCNDASAFHEDYLKEAMTLAWDFQPNERWRYTDASHYILSRIVAKRAGEPMQNLLWRTLFRPLGFRQAAWSTCPKGHAIGASGLYIRCDDMVKLGGVYLQDGRWQDRQILSPEWVKSAFTHCYDLYPIGDSGAYQKGGLHGQKLLLLPKHARAIGWLGHREDERVDLDQYVLSYFSDL